MSRRSFEADQLPLVGREREQAILDDSLTEALACRGGTVAISGEPGIGKSSLLDWFTVAANRRSVRVLRGTCYDQETTHAYGPWMEIFDGFRSDRELHALPAALQSPRSVAALESKAEFFEVAASFMVETASSAPLALVLEDLHWADIASLQLLRYLSREIVDSSILLIVSTRDSGEGASSFPSILPTLVREGRVRRISLQPLDSAATKTLVQQRYDLGEEDKARLVDFLTRQSNGNPFFLHELLQMLLERRILESRDGRWRLGNLDEAAVPSLIQQLVHERLSRLEAPTRLLLEQMAVVGNETSIEVLESLYHGSLDDLDGALQEAVEHRLILQGQGRQHVRFNHALARQAIYAAIRPLHRRRLHREVGDFLAGQETPPVSSVAAHYYLAGDERAIGWLVAAAEEALLVFAPEIVLAWSDQVLDLASRLGVSPPADIYRIQGLAQETTGDLERARVALESALRAARDSADQFETWQALIDLGTHWSSRDYRKSRDYFERALDLSRRLGDPKLRARSLNRLGNWLVNAEQPEEGLRCHNEALGILERLDDTAEIAATLDLIAVTHSMSGDAGRSVEYYRRAIPILRALDDRNTLVTALGTTSMARFGAGHSVFAPNMWHFDHSASAERYAEIDEALAIASGIGWRPGQAFSLALRARTAQMAGDFDRALADSQRAIQIARSIGHAQWQVLAHCSLGALWVDLLNLDQAVVELEQACDRASETGSSFMRGVATSFLASALLAGGEPDRATSLITPLIDLSASPMSSAQLNYWTAMAEIRIAVGEAQGALELLDQIDQSLAGPDETRAPRMLKLRGDALWASARKDEAVSVLAQAGAFASDLGFRPLAWQILLSLSELHLERGRDDLVANTRERALSIVAGLADEMEDDQLREQFCTRFRARFRERSEKSGRDAGQSFEHLSRREREVLGLVAEGLTDIDVSERLYISPRTVSQHLRSIYAKLDVSNRTAAVRAAAERELI